MAVNLVNIEEILDGIELQDGIGELTNHKKRYQLKQIAIEGVKELDVTQNFNLMSVVSAINGDGTIDVPDDYYDYVAIYVLNDKNQLVPLAKNKTINVSLDPILDQDSEPILDQNGEKIYGTGARTTLSSSSLINTGENTANNSFPYNSRSYSGATYGAGGGANRFGYFKVDVLNNTIQLDVRDDVEEVILDYVKDTVDSMYDILIPAKHRQSLRAWVYWKAIQYNRNFSRGDKESAKRDYLRERRLARRSRIRLEDWYYQNSRNQKQSLKF